ncbi:MAG: phosphatase PAP2 family protein [Synergistes sp.]|nr:phosphatase PAP2 family protein [Synergistes sp.]
MDIEILVFLQNLREMSGGCLNSFFIFVSAINGDPYLMLLPLILFWSVDKKKGMTVLGSFGLALFAGLILKSMFCVYRPWIQSSRVKPLEEAMRTASGFSFPSGHAVSAGGLYGGLISANREYKGICIFFGFMIFVTIFSRIFMGVHTPQDIIAGAAVGLLSAYIMTLLLEWADRYKNADIIVFFAALIVCAASLLYVSFKSFPMDYINGVLLVDPDKMVKDCFKYPGRFFGIMAGWLIERRFIRFKISAQPNKRVLCSLIGCFLFVLYSLAVVSFAGKVINTGLANFILQMSAPLIFMTIYPCAFWALQNRERF